MPLDKQQERIYAKEFQLVHIYSILLLHSHPVDDSWAGQSTIYLKSKIHPLVVRASQLSPGSSVELSSAQFSLTIVLVIFYMTVVLLARVDSHCTSSTRGSLETPLAS